MMNLGHAIAAVVRAITPGSQEDDRDRPYERPAYEQQAPAPTGPMLGWSNKRAYPTTGGQPGMMQRPEPLALAGQFTRGRQAAPQDRDLPPPPGESSRVTYQPPAYTPFVPQAPYQAPRPSAPSPAPSLDQQTSSSPPIYAPPPSSLYGGPPPLPEQAAVAASQKVVDASATARHVGGSSKLYSMHRSYGLEPDVIPAVEGGDRYVFIGPPDAPAPKKTDDGDDNSSDKAGDGRPF
ncbi:hypothetical protein [Phenylobacterium sp.]|uniref:hypothetical protein n=1 Tax=Phenylobacterium sp. TaxID=1871053 RepID=UPI002737D654|nr:hypothetical protein [Phenylobacterium sp.]MDP3868050.1 hypothetical protein [Phenylobacterium sp.]